MPAFTFRESEREEMLILLGDFYLLELKGQPSDSAQPFAGSTAGRAGGGHRAAGGLGPHPSRKGRGAPGAGVAPRRASCAPPGGIRAAPASAGVAAKRTLVRVPATRPLEERID